ncbi:hypothetical protein [Pseudomonas salomonii]|nr:hypothetical protein [Pseudomonas salomonii]
MSNNDVPAEVLDASRTQFGRAVTAFLHHAEIEGFCLVGRVYFDRKDRFQSGRLIRTSDLEEFLATDEYLLAVTLTGSVYVLVAPKSELLRLPGK